MTRLEEVPDRYVKLLQKLLMERAGYRDDNCPAQVRLKFEETARIGCAIIMDEEREAHAVEEEED